MWVSFIATPYYLLLQTAYAISIKRLSLCQSSRSLERSANLELKYRGMQDLDQ
jgi:hypothetical protein